MIRKFFLADDDEDDSDMFREALLDIDASLQLDRARSGRELLTRLQANSRTPEIIFLDINMPGMNGWECLAELKQHPQWKSIPVLMYSTSSPEINGRKAIEQGAIALYEKAVNYKMFRKFLKSITESSPNHLSDTLKNLRESKEHSIYIG